MEYVSNFTHSISCDKNVSVFEEIDIGYIREIREIWLETFQYELILYMKRKQEPFMRVTIESPVSALLPKHNLYTL